MLGKQLPPVPIVQKYISEFNAADVFHAYWYTILAYERLEKSCHRPNLWIG